MGMEYEYVPLNAGRCGERDAAYDETVVQPEPPEAERRRSRTVVAETVRIDRQRKIERQIDEADDHEQEKHVMAQRFLDQRVPMSIEKHQYDHRADNRRDFDGQQDAEFEW